MNDRHNHQALLDFFADYPLPTGPQHVNEYRVFLDLAGAVQQYIHRAQSEVETNRTSAVMALIEIQAWLLQQEVTAKPAIHTD